MFCQWFNLSEHLSASSEANSHPVHGLIHESTQGKTALFLDPRE